MSIIKCPMCQSVLKYVELEGPLVIGKCTAQIGRTKKLERISPIIAQLIVKEGQELHDISKVTANCIKCSWYGKATDLLIEEDSIISGKPTNYSIDFPGFGNIFILEQELQLAREIFDQKIFINIIDNELVLQQIEV